MNSFLRTMLPKIGSADPGLSTYLHGSEVLPTGSLKGKSLLTGDSTLHVTRATRGTVHHVCMIKQQWCTDALLSTGLIDAAGNDRIEHLRNGLRTNR